MPLEMSESWKPHIESVMGSPGVVVIVGATDTGKTSLCTLLANEAVRSGLKAAVVDGDLGQSEIGPPTTVGMGFVESGIQSLGEIRARSLYFVGSTTPIGNLLSSATGMKRLTDEALTHGPDLVIADTSGLVQGATARRLKTHKIELLRPKHILAIQRTGEAEHFLRLFDTWEDCAVHRLVPSPLVRPKTRGLRTQRRTIHFQRYLQGSEQRVLNLAELATSGAWLGTGTPMEPRLLKFAESVLKTEVLHGETIGRAAHLITRGEGAKRGIEELQEFFKTRSVVVVPANRYHNLLVGLMGSHLTLLTLAIIREIDFTAGTISVLTPLRSMAPVKSIRFGIAKVRPDGVEIGQLRPGEI